MEISIRLTTEESDSILEIGKYMNDDEVHICAKSVNGTIITTLLDITELEKILTLLKQVHE